MPFFSLPTSPSSLEKMRPNAGAIRRWAADAGPDELRDLEQLDVGRRPVLDAVALALKDQEDHKMVVEGHTDSQGTESSNLDLSQRRAQSVRDYLVSRGVPGDKITAIGIGQGRPVASNSSADGRAANRRVEIIVQPLEKR